MGSSAKLLDISCADCRYVDMDINTHRHPKEYFCRFSLCMQPREINNKVIKCAAFNPAESGWDI